MRRHAKAIVAASALLLLTMALGVNFATATAPTVSINAPSNVSYTSVHVSGKVDPEDQETSYYFQYSTEPGNEFSWQSGAYQGPLAANSGEANVSDDLSGLSPGTEYFVRLVAESADGQTISAEPHPSFTTDAVAPAAVSIDAPTSVTSSGAHFSGTIDPEAPGGNPAAFDVNWEFQCTPECPGLAGGTIPADSDPHTVEADATGLKPGTTYEVTLVATNAGGSASAGPEGFTTLTTAPVVLSSKAFPTSTEATLQAQVNPGGLATTYYFEYGSTAAYGQSTVAKTLKAGGDPVTASAPVFGLSPSSGYHFRVVATNAAGSDEGPDVAFATSQAEGAADSCPNALVRAQQGSQHLPDCRAYEMVSPAEKQGSPVGLSDSVSAGLTASAANGEAVVFMSWGRFADAEGGMPVSYRSRRTPQGWATEAVSPASGVPHPHAPTFTTTWGLTSLNLDVGYANTADSFDPTDVNGNWGKGGPGQDVYRLGPNQETELISRGNGGERTGEFGATEFTATSDDGAHAIFRTSANLVPEDADRFPPADISNIATHVYDVYDRFKGKTYLLNKDNSGQLLNKCGSALGADVTARGMTSRNAASSDGTRLIFATPEEQRSGHPDCEKPQQLYMRVNHAETIHISASQRSVPDPGGTQPATYEGASDDGGLVFFSSGEMLTDATSGGLYRYDVDAGVLSLLIPFPVFLKTVKISADGSHVYFISYEKLNGEGIDGENLYVWEDGTVRWVVGDPTYRFDGSLRGPEQGRTAVVTPDGEHLVFATRAELTSFDTAGRSEVYLYDDLERELTCVSCDPGGQRPSGSVATSNAGLRGAEDRNSPVSPDGERVVFQTRDRLMARDTNTKQDVYLFQDGKLELISSGRSEDDSILIGMDRAGENVFFASPDSLVGADTDGGDLDIYDARVHGGFLEPPARRENAACGGEGCQPALPTPPSLTPGSAAVAGSGNALRRKNCTKVPKGKARKAKKKMRCQKSKKNRSGQRKHRVVAAKRGGVR